MPAALTSKLRLGLVALAAGCASTADDLPQWSAFGFLSPSMDRDPEVIGLFHAKSACDAAADAWMARQVVGNPVSAQCLPIDRN